jgi:hypothetical protein
MSKITRISMGPVGDKLWWFGPYAHIRKVPAGCSTSGAVEWFVDLLPTDKIYFHRTIRCRDWNHARAVMASPYDAVEFQP